MLLQDFRWVDLFESKVLARGFDIFLSERVNIYNYVQRDDGCSAFVHGNNADYQVSLSFADFQIIQHSCTCPYALKGKACKHEAALAFKALFSSSGSSLQQGQLVDCLKENIAKLSQEEAGQLLKLCADHLDNTAGDTLLEALADRDPFLRAKWAVRKIQLHLRYGIPNPDFVGLGYCDFVQKVIDEEVVPLAKDQKTAGNAFIALVDMAQWLSERLDPYADNRHLLDCMEALAREAYGNADADARKDIDAILVDPHYSRNALVLRLSGDSGACFDSSAGWKKLKAALLSTVLSRMMELPCIPELWDKLLDEIEYAKLWDLYVKGIEHLISKCIPMTERWFNGYHYAARSMGDEKRIAPYLRCQLSLPADWMIPSIARDTYSHACIYVDLFEGEEKVEKARELALLPSIGRSAFRLLEHAGAYETALELIEEGRIQYWKNELHTLYKKGYQDRVKRIYQTHMEKLYAEAPSSRPKAYRYSGLLLDYACLTGDVETILVFARKLAKDAPESVYAKRYLSARLLEELYDKRMAKRKDPKTPLSYFKIW